MVKPIESPQKKAIKLTFPYKVDYNDHFSTPLIAYQDILPLLDAVVPSTKRDRHLLNESSPNPALDSSFKQAPSPIDSSAGGNRGLEIKMKKKRRWKRRDDEISSSSNVAEMIDSNIKLSNRSDHILYDPYYCDGSAANLLRSLGFTKIKHEKRDFYEDVQNKTLPFYHTLVTNPPYSGSHKERCVRFAVDNLRENNGDATDGSHHFCKPFFILMPNYIACRDHFRAAICPSSMNQTEDPPDIFYVLPSKPYEYEHPAGTGKEISPFASIWFCGVHADKVEYVKNAFRKAYGDKSVGLLSQHSFENDNYLGPRFVSSFKDLKHMRAIPTKKRRNPKQRRKEKLRQSVKSETETSFVTSLENNKTVTKSCILLEEKCATKPSKVKRKRNKQSIYRNPKGIRKKQRF